MCTDLKSLAANTRRAEVLKALFSADGKVIQIGEFFEQIKDELSYVTAMKSISLIDILEYAEQQKLITIHRENFKE